MVVLAIQLCGGIAAKAASAHFNDQNRGPASSFQVGDITVSAGVSGPYTGLPATVSGFGLGSAGPVGEIYSFDEQLHYSAGDSFPDAMTRENSIAFDIDPSFTFTSMTIRPYLTVSGSGGAPPCSFTMEYDVTGTTGAFADQYYCSADPGNFGQPLTISLTPRPGMQFYQFNLQLDTGLAGGEALNFYQYRQDHLGEEQTLQFGFTIESLEYSPVPEPAAMTLLLLGGAIWWWRKTKSLRHRFA
jgi:hypothetical protein